MQPPHPVIRSRDNSLVKRFARVLAGESNPHGTESVALPGAHLLRACLEAPEYGPAVLRTVLISELAAGHPDVASLVERLRPESVRWATGPVFEKLGPATGTNAILGLMEMPRRTPEGLEPKGLRLALDGVQDPGNVGTLIRTAAAAGASAVIAGAGCADPWSPKAMRAGMGGQFSLPVVAVADLAEWLLAQPGQVVAADAAAAGNLFDTEFSYDLLIVLGGEGQGLAPAVRRAVQSFVRIPMAAGTDSLNVGAAGAVLCYEWFRQHPSGAGARTG